MQSKTYWVGDRPAGAWNFQILDESSGEVQALTGFTSVRVRLLDPKNKPVEIDEQYALISDAATGTVTFYWPTESLFTKPGRYVMQLELTSGTATRRTTVQEIVVRELGGVLN